MTRPKESNVDDYVRIVYPTKISTWIELLGSTTVVIGIACVIYGLLTLPKAGDIAEPNFCKRLILAAWVVLPPGWFCIEYFLIFKKHGLPGSFEIFKHGQEVAARFWLAVGTVLSALYLGPHVIDQLSKHSGP